MEARWRLGGGALALVGLGACGGSSSSTAAVVALALDAGSDAAQNATNTNAASSNATNADAANATNANAVSTHVDAGTGAQGTAPCGAAAERCCSEGALCGAGLSCSDEYCLACGPLPAPNVRCTALITAGVGVSAGVYPSGSESDEARAVVDRDVCTPWNYGNYGDANAYFEVDLRYAADIDALTVWPKMTPADGKVRLSIQYRSTTADVWHSYPTAEGLVLTLHDYVPWQTTFEPAITARYVRITILDTPSFAALREVGLFAGCTSAN